MTPPANPNGQYLLYPEAWHRAIAAYERGLLDEHIRTHLQETKMAVAAYDPDGEPVPAPDDGDDLEQAAQHLGGITVAQALEGAGHLAEQLRAIGESLATA